jgi:LysM repeat protein
MRVFAFPVGLKRLFSIAAVAAVSLALLVLSGCGHRCGCNKCSTCGGGTAYNHVGNAPQSLSDTGGYQGTSAGASASFERVGESKDLPVFSAPPSNPPSVSAPPYTPPAVSQAAIIPQGNPPPGGGQYHTMQQGDTIYGLSRKYGVKPKSILEANHFTDPNHLAVGTRVYIPSN